MILQRLASLRITVVVIPVLAMIMLAIYRFAWLSSTWLLPPLLVLSVNLCAALVVDARLRRSHWLLLFHLCLFAFMLLAQLQVLLGFSGRVELAEGQPFAPALVQTVEQGALHRAGLDRLQFVQGRVEVDYSAGLRRGETRTQIRLADSGAAATISDLVPLEQDGYHFKITPNKGYAAALRWIQDDVAMAGWLHFPSYPAQAWRQLNDWQTPAGQALTLRLIVPEPDESTSWTLRGRPSQVELEVRWGENKHILQPGESIALQGGRLYFDAVDLWIGYRIDRDPVLPWLLAVGFLGALALAGHVAGRSVHRSRFAAGRSEANDIHV